MPTITIDEFRDNMDEIINRAIDKKKETIIMRDKKKREGVVVISRQEWAGTLETLHLLSSPKNARRLRASIKQLDGDGSSKKKIKVA